MKSVLWGLTAVALAITGCSPPTPQGPPPPLVERVLKVEGVSRSRHKHYTTMTVTAGGERLCYELRPKDKATPWEVGKKYKFGTRGSRIVSWELQPDEPEARTEAAGEGRPAAAEPSPGPAPAGPPDPANPPGGNR